MAIKSLKGTEDILPKDVRFWNHIEAVSRKKFSVYGYKEIRTPIIEESSLFIRGVGEETDIVRKQMYAFADQGGHNICLRPEETAPVVRAYLEHHLDKEEGFVKLFYIGPMFRGERPQAGRLRQFHQIGVEAIGSYSIYTDAEVAILLDDLLQDYGLKGYMFKINSLGCLKDKEKLKGILRKELKTSLNLLCSDCQRRYQSNILRVLDCKSESCRRLVSSLPLFNTFLCPDCSREFDNFKNILNHAGLKYEVNPFLVRGLDYYTKIVFEVNAKQLGAQDAVAAGGRYDNLVSDFGGTKTGACGFAIGMERVISVLEKVCEPFAEDDKLTVFVATLGDEAYAEGFKILNTLRKSGVSADIDYQKRSLKAQMRCADRYKANYVVIIGEDELKKGQAIIRDMSGAVQESVALGDVVKRIFKNPRSQ